jgi:hypothetical protein
MIVTSVSPGQMVNIVHVEVWKLVLAMANILVKKAMCGPLGASNATSILRTVLLSHSH